MWSKKLCCFITLARIEEVFDHGMGRIMRVDLDFHGTEPKPIRVGIGVKATKVCSL